MSRGQTKRERQKALRGMMCRGTEEEIHTEIGAVVERKELLKKCNKSIHRYSRCLDTGGDESKAQWGKLLREMRLSPLKSDDFIPTFRPKLVLQEIR